MAKKKQHYIPKFYLRNFSIENNPNVVGIFNLTNSHFIEEAPLRDQCTKKFFYGKDEVIENYLSQVEGDFAHVIKTIIENQNTNKKDKEEIDTLLMFVLLTDLRSLTAIENLKDFPNRIDKLEINLKIPEITHEEAVKIMLSNIMDIFPSVSGLEYKLLKNETKTSFISSDFPIAKYNYLYENIPTYFSVTGYSSKGIIIFLPLSPSITVVFYDRSTYKFGSKRNNAITLNNENEVDQLNLLQYLNARETVFFNEAITEKYIMSLKNMSTKFSKPNEPLTFLADFQRINGTLEKDSLLVHRHSDTFIKLNLSCLKIHSGSHSQTIDPTKAGLRN